MHTFEPPNADERATNRTIHLWKRAKAIAKMLSVDCKLSQWWWTTGNALSLRQIVCQSLIILYFTDS